MAENYTTYTEVDPNSRITITSATRIDYAGIARNESAYVYVDKGAAYYSGNFSFNVDINITSGTGSAGEYSFSYPWGVCNSVENAKAVLTNSGQLLCVEAQETTIPILVIAEYYNGVRYPVAITTALAHATNYYLTIRRDESVGTYGTLYLDVYSDTGRTTLIETKSVTLHALVDFRYLYGFNNYNDGVAWAQTGYFQNLTEILTSGIAVDPLTGAFTIPAPGVSNTIIVFPSTLTGAFTVSTPTTTGPAIVTPDPVTGAFTLNAPDVMKVIVLVNPVTGTFTIAVPTVDLPMIVTVNPVTGTFSILAPDVTEIVAVLLGVSNFPQGATVEYEIIDSDGVTLQAWTSIGVNEEQGPSKSAYYVKTNVIGGGVESRGVIYWRTSDLAYEASDIFDTTQANIATLLQRLTYNRALNLDKIATTAETADAVWDEVLTKATHNVTNSAGKRLRQLGGAHVHDGEAQAGGTNTITLDTGASATDYIYNEGLVVIVGGTAAGEAHHIMSYNGTTKVAVVDQNWYTVPDTTSEFIIFGSSAHDTVSTGLSQAASSTTMTLNGDASTVDDYYIDMLLVIPSGTGGGQARRVTDYDGATKVATVSPAWTTTPDNTSAYMVYPMMDIPTLTEIEGSTVLAMEASITTAQANITTLLSYAVTMSKWKNNKLVETDNGDGTKTVVLYDDDNATPLLSWVVSTATTTRAKAT